MDIGEARPRRHFTASGYVVHQGRVLLHWHRKVRAFLPPGGHIEADEDPVEALLREVREETGLAVEVLTAGLALGVSYPIQVPSPEVIMVEDIRDPVDGFHQHMDMIYFCRPVGSLDSLKDGWHWVREVELASGAAVAGGESEGASPPPDVRRLALEALRREREGA